MSGQRHVTLPRTETEPISRNARAQRRVYVANHVLTRELTARQAAAYLEPSVRPVRRLLAACRSEAGAVALRTATAAVGRRTTTTTQAAPDWSNPPPPPIGTSIAPI